MSTAFASRSRSQLMQALGTAALCVLLCAALLYECAYSVGFDSFLTRTRATDGDGLNALLIAVDRGEIRRVQSLLKRGIDVDGGDLADETPLMRAAASHRADMCALLIEHGADLNASTWTGQNVLMLAVVTNDEQILRLLLSRGAGTDAPTPTGRTALMTACSAGNPRLATILIEAGADVNAASDQGVTPMIDAATAGADGMPALIRLLATSGADVNAVDRSGNSAITEARLRDSPETVNLLLSLGARQTRATPDVPVPDSSVKHSREHDR